MIQIFEWILYFIEYYHWFRPRFGQKFDLNRDNFTQSIDGENKNVTIIVHVYEQGARGCQLMDKCFDALAEQYPYVKFCRIQASEAQMSHNFVWTLSTLKESTKLFI